MAAICKVTSLPLLPLLRLRLLHVAGAGGQRPYERYWVNAGHDTRVVAIMEVLEGVGLVKLVGRWTW